MALLRGSWWRFLVGGLAIAYVLSGLVDAVFLAAQARGLAGASIILALHAVALGCCAVVLRQARAELVLLGVAAAAGLVAQDLVEYAGVMVLFVVVWIAPFRMRMAPAVLFTVAVVGGFLAVSVIGSVPPSAMFGIAAGLGWAVLFAFLVRQLSVTRQQAAVVAQARAGEAVLAERQRLAREIHDVLAHSLSAQVVHLEGTRLLLETECDTAQVLDRVATAGDLARAGLEETKRAVEALRGDETPLTDQLARLATEFRTVTGRSCSLDISDGVQQLSPEVRLTVLRTAQEALTNVHKHAPTADVTMALRRAAPWCVLEVRDTGGCSGGLAAMGTGYGLMGMRERAELIGGDLEAGSDGNGFLVRLRVPA